MPTYQVHLYAIVRVRVECVRAMSPSDAARVAEQAADLDRLFENAPCPSTRSCPQVTRLEYAGDVIDSHVEESDGEDASDGVMA